LNLAITSGGTGAGGKALQVRKARGTWLLRRHDNQWLIEAVRILPTEKDRVELIPSLAAATSLRPHLRAFVAAYEDTFNRHDPEALSAFYRDDADIIVREGPVIHGAQAIRKWWRDYFSQPRPYRVLLIIKEIRRMSDVRPT
jgi:ketosteroid isomerase-like protein